MPESALRSDYVVASFSASDDPSYFTVIAIEDDTELTWYPPVPTAGNGFPIPFVGVGESGTISMGRYDHARIAASASATPNHIERDVSGTVVHASKPVWVVGGVRCAEVPESAARLSWRRTDRAESSDACPGSGTTRLCRIGRCCS